MMLISENYQNILRKNIKKIAVSLFLLFFAAQVMFQLETQHLKPNVHIVPPVPNKYLLKALALGDEEFLFRVLSLKIQNAGDSFGRFTPLKNYDYQEMYEWFKAMDTLNSKSKVMPSIATYYYAQTQNRKDVIHIIRYLDERATADLDNNWWWLFQSVYLARRVLGDEQLALKIAYKLSKNQDENAPLWTKQLPAFLHARLGHECEAYFIIKRILDDNESGKRKLTQEELNFMSHFIKERIASFKNTNFDATKCKTR
jgi:hypothetical protein